MPWDLMWTVAGVVCGPVMSSVTACAASGRSLFPPGWWRPTPTSGALGTTVATCAALAMLGYRFAGSPELPAWCWLAVTGIQLVLIDLVCHRLPRPIVGAMFVGGVVLLGLASVRSGDATGLVRGLTVSCVVFACALVLAVAVAPQIGSGDVALLGAVGLYLGWVGWQQVVLGLLYTVMSAGLVAVLLVAGHRISREPLAVGPAIVGGTVLAVVAQ